MWKSACVGVYQLLNWKMHGETLKFYTDIIKICFPTPQTCKKLLSHVTNSS